MAIMESASKTRTNLSLWVADNSVGLLRCAIGIVFLWFGVLKLFPGLSPAEDLAAKTLTILTFGLVKPAISVPLLGLLEAALGLLLISGKAVKVAVSALLVHMAGTLTPLLFFPHDTFSAFPLQPNLVGQYILKNLVLITGALVVATANVAENT
jgi:uncharacterized membrane protein YkgB